MSEDDNSDTDGEEVFRCHLNYLRVGTTSVSWRIDGKPLPMKRYKTGKGHSWNPSGKDQKACKDAISELFDSVEEKVKAKLKKSRNLILKIDFFLPRPLKHYVGNDRKKN